VGGTGRSKPAAGSTHGVEGPATREPAKASYGRGSQCVHQCVPMCPCTGVQMPAPLGGLWASGACVSRCQQLETPEDPEVSCSTDGESESSCWRDLCVSMYGLLLTGFHPSQPKWGTGCGCGCCWWLCEDCSLSVYLSGWLCVHACVCVSTH